MRGSPWWWLVVGSALVLAVTGLAMGGRWAASRETLIADYRVVGTLSAVELDLDAASVDLVGGGGGAVSVRRTDEYAFGRRPVERRGVEAGVLRIASRCSDRVLGTCRTAYRITMPDNVRVEVRTSSGRVRVVSLNGSLRVASRSGQIAVVGFCGFSLSATSESGEVSASTACSPDRLELRSDSGDVRAVVPAGRYRVDAQSDEGAVRVRGLDVAEDASFGVQALSGSGDVVVEAGG